jgi:hypothetical protein
VDRALALLLIERAANSFAIYRDNGTLSIGSINALFVPAKP